LEGGSAEIAGAKWPRVRPAMGRVRGEGGRQVKTKCGANSFVDVKPSSEEKRGLWEKNCNQKQDAIRKKGRKEGTTRRGVALQQQKWKERIPLKTTWYELQKQGQREKDLERPNFLSKEQDRGKQKGGSQGAGRRPKAPFKKEEPHGGTKTKQGGR